MLVQENHPYPQLQPLDWTPWMLESSKTLCSCKVSLNILCAFFKGSAGSLVSVLVLCTTSHISLSDNPRNEQFGKWMCAQFGYINIFPPFTLHLISKDLTVKNSEIQGRSEQKTRNATPLNGDVMKQKREKYLVDYIMLRVWLLLPCSLEKNYIYLTNVNLSVAT